MQVTAHKVAVGVTAPIAGLTYLERLVGFDTTSRNSNLDCIDWLETELTRLGGRCLRVPSPDGLKAGLFASFGPVVLQGGLVLSGHSDVVPAQETDWRSNPFVVTQRDGRFYGRGVADMKGFIASVLATLAQTDPAALKKPLHVAISYDEEIGCKGVPVLIDAMVGKGFAPAACIVGEPTSMQVVGMHKGAMAFECKVVGLPVHSSQAPRGVNAVEYAARLIEFIRVMALDLVNTEIAQPSFEIPHSTIQTGVIAGGTAGNIVAGECMFRFDMRCLPGTDPRHMLARIEAHAATMLEPEMRRLAPNASIEIKLLGEVPGFEEPVTTDLTRLIQGVVGGPVGASVSYGTEAGFFQRAGMSVVICGPGDMADAHQANESIEPAQLVACETALATIIDRFCVSTPA